MNKESKCLTDNKELFEIISGTLDTEDNLDSQRHKYNVKRGKVLLKMLSTVNSPDDITSWLEDIQFYGNFYIFHDYFIVRRNTSKKEVVNVNDLPDLKDILDPKLFSIVHAQTELMNWLNNFSTSKGLKDLNRLKQLSLPFLYYIAKLHNVLHKPEYQVGEIYHQDDMAAPADISLIDLYMIQKGIDSEEEAIDEFADRNNIPEEIFKPVKIDKRTHWRQKMPSCHGSIEQHEYIEFRDRNLLLGNILVDENGIIAPETYWSNHRNFIGHPLRVPFSDKYPVWHLDEMQNNKNATVYLTDSLCMAYQSDKQTRAKIKELDDKIEYLQNMIDGKLELSQEKDLIDKLLNTREVVIDKLPEDILKIIRDKYNDSDHESIIKKIYYIAIKVVSSPIWQKQYEAEDDSGKEKIFEKLFMSLKYWRFNEKSKLDQMDTAKEIDIPSKIYGYIESIMQYIPQFKQIHNETQNYFDKKRSYLIHITEVNKKLKNIIWSGWYGEKHTAKNVDWKPLKNRDVYYIIRKLRKNDYLMALAMHSKLENIKFLIKSENSNPKRNQLKLLPVEQFRGIAEKKFKITNKDIKSFFDEENSIDIINKPSRYNPKEKKVETLPKNDFLLSPLIKEKSISLLYSEPGVGKSWIALSIAQSLCNSCSTFLSNVGWRAYSPKRVLIIDSEMSERVFLERLGAMDKHYEEMSKEENNGKKINKGSIEYKLVAQDDWDLTSEDGEHRAQINKWLRLGKKEKIDYLILDNLSTLSGYNDSAKSWKNLFSWLQRIKEKGCSTIILHHANKTTGDQRGSSLKAATVDNIIRVRKALPGKKSNLAVTFKIEKARDAHSEALEPFTVFLKFTNGNAKWKTPYAKGIKSISNAKRNKMICQALKSQAFSQQIIADYFGIDIGTIKGIIADEKAKKPKTNR